MRVKIIILALLFFALIACEKGIENPYSPEIPEPTKKPANVLLSWSANFYPNVDPPYEPPYATEAEWRVWGTFTNIGELPAKNIEIRSRIYDSSHGILWEGNYLFINPNSSTSYLDGGEACDFVASWEGLDITIFYELDENGKPIGDGNWDSTATYGSGIKYTWEAD